MTTEQFETIEQYLEQIKTLSEQNNLGSLKENVGIIFQELEAQGKMLERIEKLLSDR
jgi:hypothetical protein